MGSWEGQVSESKPEPSCCRGGGGGAGAGETAGCRVEPGLACLWPWECREGRALWIKQSGLDLQSLIFRSLLGGRHSPSARLQMRKLRHREAERFH